MIKKIIVEALLAAIITSCPPEVSGIYPLQSHCESKIVHEITYSVNKNQNRVERLQRKMYLLDPTDEEIKQEKRDGEKALLAQLVEAEAGNQDLYGKRLVADVVLNRVESDLYPDTIEEVIFQEGQFGVITDGSFEMAAYCISQDSFQAASMEYDKKKRTNEDILYFNYKPHRKNMWKYGDHYFK